MTDGSAVLLTTARLTLRPPELGDLDDTFALWADPEVVRFISGRPSTREEAWARLHRNIGLWAAHGYGPLIVRDKASGRLAGEVGLANFGREIDPPVGPLEAGWVLAPWAHGKGFATEAVLACLDWARVRFAGQRATCIIDLDNAASLSVAERCGFKACGQTDYKGATVAMFERLI
jgi:RimJ/RimL family protein N-acetyltransferase